MPHRRRRSSGGGSRSRSRSRQRSQSRRSSQRRQRSRSRAAQRSQSKRRSQQRRQQREDRANVREQARSAPQRAAQRAAKARAAAPSYLAGLQAAGGLSGTQGAGAGQANRLANEYGQKGTTDARKREISKQLKDVRSQLNIDNRKRSFDNLLKASKTNKGLVARDSSGNIITDSSGNPIMSSAGKDVFDQTRQGYSDRSEYLRQTNPELYGKMYPVASAAMNLLPKAMQAVIPGGTILKNIASSLKDKTGKIADSGIVSDARAMASDLTGGLTGRIKSGIGSIFDRFQNDQGSTSGPAMSSQGGGGQGGGGQGGTPEGTTFQQASDASWAGIYNRLIGQGMTPEQARQRMAEMGQSGMIGTFGPIPPEFRIENILKPFDPSEGVIGGIPGISQPMRPGPIRQPMQPGPIQPSIMANTPANAIAAFNKAQPMSTQQLSFGAPQQPQGLGQFSSMLNRFS
jgi:hypothetical protein